MHLKKLLPLLLMVMVLPFLAKAQVTTSTITGTVLSAKNEPLEGATITATHTPSGTVYTTVAKRGGAYTLPSLRIGGPYVINVTSAGKQDQTINDVTLSLGEPYNLNVTMEDRTTDLAAVVVTAIGTRTARDKTGASTNINSRLLTTLPTISRSITDFTRITPQASGNGFAGRDPRNNNITVDGANLNNNFGLNTDPLPGGGVNPISLDALEEVSVNIAPFDVRQANFTGANVSAVTKSGTNTFKGTAYTYYKDESFNGLNVKNVKLPDLQSSYSKIFGATLGGPIIKNKLFFFGSYEYEERSAVLNYYTPTGPGASGSGNISAVSIDSLKKVADYLNSKYQFDPGAYDNFNTGVPLKNHKILGKIDWNISKTHKLTLKYSELVSTGSSLPSQSGGINGANSSGIITHGPKFSATAMAFGGTIYSTEDIVRSGSFELNSNFRGKFANQLLATYTKIETNKDHPGAQFPFVDIMGPVVGDKTNYISFGNEPFNGNYNVVQNDVLTITNNFTYFAGRHTITAGASYEYQKVGNGFMAGSQGYYVFGSVDDFVNNRAPKLFSQTYSLIPGQDAVISAELKIGQLGIYAQDEFNVTDKLKITAGLRVDKPIYPEQPLENKAISALNLYDHAGNLTKYTTGRWPKATPYFSPRIGFRWSVPDEKMIVRGGTGIFTGRIPFVYLTNIPTNSGMYQVGALVTTGLQNFLFNPDPHTYNPFYNTTLNPAQFPTTAGTNVPTGAYALTAEKFKFPQVWRANFAVDKQLGKGWGLTLETILTKDINAVYMFNANQKLADSVVITGAVSRPRYTTSAGRKLNATSGNAVVLDNTSKGGSLAVTAQINKSFSKGLYAMAAYTYTGAWDVTANPGSQANSVWSANPTSRTQNDLELSNSNFNTPHRLIATVSYRKEYFKHFATTISLFYEGASQGNISYIYNGDLNNDGNSADLMYIPKDPTEIRFANLAATGTAPAFTAQQQSDAFFAFIAQDKYLSKHMGQVAERNGARLPFFHRVDLKIAQDLFTNIGGRKNTLQITADMFNALNFINKNWGVRQFAVVANPLRLTGVTAGVPTFTLATYIPNGETVARLVDRTYINNYSTSSTWSMQLGLRYIF